MTATIIDGQVPGAAGHIQVAHPPQRSQVVQDVVDRLGGDWGENIIILPGSLCPEFEFGLAECFCLHWPLQMFGLWHYLSEWRLTCHRED